VGRKQITPQKGPPEPYPAEEIMMAFKHNFAQKLWQQAQKDESDLCNILRTYPSLNREHLHKRLDQIIDKIERKRAKAVELYPDVKESLVVARIEL
jgi:hypothetical protein